MQLITRLTSNFKSVITVLVVSITLSGCLLVDDFGEFWKKAHADVDLVGQWHHTKSVDNLIFMKQGDHLVYMDKNTGKAKNLSQFKTLKSGKYKLLLSRNDKAQALFYYTIEADVFTVFGPKKDARADFLKFAAGTDNIRLETQGVRIKKLDNDALVSINHSIDAGIWVPVATMTRGIAETNPDGRMTLEQLKAFEKARLK